MPKRKSDLSKISRSCKRSRQRRIQETNIKLENQLPVIKEELVQTFGATAVGETSTHESYLLEREISKPQQRRDLETPEQRQKRLTANEIRTAQLQRLETPAQRKPCLLLDRYRKALKLQSETPEQRNARLLKKRTARRYETLEQREKRLATGRQRKAQLLAFETPEQREKRLATERRRKAQLLAVETPEQREKRLATERQRKAQQLALETPEQRERRLASNRRRQNLKRASETPEQREKRLATNREYIARKRFEKKLVGLQCQPTSSNSTEEEELPVNNKTIVIEINPIDNTKSTEQSTLPVFVLSVEKTKIVIPGKMDIEEATPEVTIKNEIDIEEETLIRVKTEVTDGSEVPHPESDPYDNNIEIEIKEELNPELNYLVEREDITDKPTVIREADTYNKQTIDDRIKEEQAETIVSYDYPNFDDGSMDSNEAEALGNVETSLQVDIKHENGGHQNFQMPNDYQNNELPLESDLNSSHIVPDMPETVSKYSFVMKIPGEVMSNIDQIVTSCLMNGTTEVTEPGPDCTTYPDDKATDNELHMQMSNESHYTTEQKNLLQESDKSEMFDLNPFQLNSITGNVLSLEQEAYNMLKPQKRKRKKVACPKCPKAYISKYSLKPHLKVHKTIENYRNGWKRGLETKKKNASKRIKLLKKQLEEHDSQDSCSNNQEIKVENKEGYKCTCGKSFQRKTRMETCLRSHDCCESEKFYCMTCLKDFKSKDELALHRKRLHRKKFPCKFCPTDYATRKKLFRHLQIHQKVHQMEYKVIEEFVKGKKKLRCFLCSKLCEDISQLKIHVMSEHEGPYSCPHCKNTFPKIIDFANHTKAYHPEVGGQSVMDVLEAFSRLTQEWKCEECGLQFLEADKLALHQVEQHNPEIKSEHQFQCPDCRRVFISQKGLTSHRRIHHSVEVAEPDKIEDPGIMCLECRKMCKDMTALTSHMRFHSPDRKYPCKFCDFRFATPEKRKTHAEIHTGDMKYVCFICEYQCSSENRLKKHKQSLKHANMREYLLTGKPLLEESSSKDKEKKEVSAKKKKKAKEESKSDSCSKVDSSEVSCDVCGEQFPSESQMLEHKETHPFIEIPSADKPTRIFFK